MRIYCTAIVMSALVAGCSAEGNGDEVAQLSDIAPQIQVSRSEGVAPLAVFFDATGTTGLTDDSYIDATFSWDFDADELHPEASYRLASGFVAAHVYEHPGTYRVHLDIIDRQGRTAAGEATVDVVSFSGQTYYVASDGLDTNTGTSMDDPVQTVRHALIDLAQPDTRILFRNGDTFETTFIDGTGHDGPVIIANYSDPDSPSEQAPIIYSTAVDADWQTLWLGDDWRIMNLRVRSGGSTSGESGPRYPGGVGFGPDCHNSLIYRLEQDNLLGVPLGGNGQYNTVAECHIHDASGGGYSNEGDGAAIIGNWVHDMDDDDLEHIYRLQTGTRSFIAFNDFEGNAVNYDSLTVRGDAEKVVIYRNILDRVTSIVPQNRNSAEEYQHHCVVDSNLFVGRVDPPGYTTGSPIRQQALALDSKDIVVRNNIFYNYEQAIGIADDTVVGPSRRIKIYNNTYINATPDSYFYFVSVDPSCSAIDIHNNLMLDVAGSDPLYTKFIWVNGGASFTGGTSENNLFYGISWSEDIALFGTVSLAEWRVASGQDQRSAMQDPMIEGVDLSHLVAGDLARPAGTSPAVDRLDIGAALDFYGSARSDLLDIGAVEYTSGEPASPWFLPLGDTEP